MKVDSVLVLGGSGFIGRHLVARLARREIRVTVPSRRRERAKHLILLPTVDVVEADVLARGTLERLAAGKQAVINLSASCTATSSACTPSCRRRSSTPAAPPA
jgi:NADH dehydrogenase